MENHPKLDILNARTIRFECPHGVAIDYLTNDRGEIVQINYSGNKANISVGARFVLDIDGTVTNYEVVEIESGEDEYTFMLNTHKLTKSTSFLTPILTIVPDTIGYKTNFINTYLRNITSHQLVLLYRNTKDKECELLYKALRKLKFYVEDKNVDEFYTAFIFDIDENFQKDVGLFLKGKYSKLSELLKTRIIRFHKLNKNTMLHKVLYRDPTLKRFVEMKLQDTIPDDLDLYSIPDLKIEVLEI